MKYLLIVSLTFFFNHNIFSQNSSANQVAKNIAKKMADSLGLSQTQKDSIYSINIHLHNLKMDARQHYTESDSVVIKIQKIEYKRDSLYHLVLNDEQFLIYQSKKKNLVNNN